MQALGGVQQTHMGAMVMEDLTPCFSGHQMVAIELPRSRNEPI